MVSENKFIQQLRYNLSQLDPYLVLLFGSFAYGTPDADSDLDVFVVFAMFPPMDD